MNYVLLHDAGFEHCSEADMVRSMRIVLDAVHGGGLVYENPIEPPTEQYTVWAIMPRFQLRIMGWVKASRWDPRCVAALALDVDDGCEGLFDFYLTTVDNTRPSHSFLDSYLKHLGGEWPEQQRWPWMPYLHHIPEADIAEAVPDDEAPRHYVLWNAEQHGVSEGEGAYAETILPMLKTLGIHRVVMAHRNRSGQIGSIEDDPWFYVEELPTDCGAEQYHRVLARAAAYVVSAPSLQMLSIERALAFGVPIYAARKGRWAEHFSHASEIRAMYADRELYAMRRWAWSEHFGLGAACARVGQAMCMAQQLRTQRTWK